MQHFGPMKVKIDHTNQPERDIHTLECWTILFAWSEDLAASRRMQECKVVYHVSEGRYRDDTYIITYIRTYNL